MKIWKLLPPDPLPSPGPALVKPGSPELSQRCEEENDQDVRVRPAHAALLKWQIKGPDNPTCVICIREAGLQDERWEEICIMSVV